MAELIYNGIRLGMGRLASLTQEAVYDPAGVNYLYTHFRVRVVAVVNPKTVSNLGGGGVVRDVAPARAMETIRKKLLTPRKVLQLSIGASPAPSEGIVAGDVILESPQRRAENNVRFPSDANNGPKPIRCDVLEFHGAHSCIVDYEIETWLNECEGTPGNHPPILLSHTWTMSEDLSEDHLATRTISGQAVFRTDFLPLFGVPASPDDFRGRLAHPCPFGFKRIGLNVAVSEDGTAISYTITDRQQETKWSLKDNTTIVRIEGSHAEGWNYHDETNPSFHFDARVEVWGRPDATSEDLVNACLSALTSIFGKRKLTQINPANQVVAGIAFAIAGVKIQQKAIEGPPNALNPAIGFAAQVHVDFPRRHAVVHYEGMYGGACVGTAGVALLTGMGELLNAKNFPEDFGVFRGVDGEQPTFIADGNTRTTTRVRLISQVLNGDCAEPTAVSDPGDNFRIR